MIILIHTNKYIQNDNYIIEIKNAYNELTKSYKDGELVEVQEDFNNHNWFYMEYDKESQKYKYNQNEIDKLMDIYTNKMDNKSFYMKYYVDAQNRNLSIYSKITNNEIGTYIPDIKSLMINKEFINDYNEVKEELNSILEVNELSFYEVKPYNN